MIERATEATDELVEALGRLLPQLAETRRPPTRDELDELARTQALFVARLDGRIMGTLTLALYRAPTGLRAVVEDVVVDGEARGRGLGEALTRAGIEHAEHAGAVTVALTSHPSRAAANRLYRRLGFELRETNVYRLSLPSRSR